MRIVTNTKHHSVKQMSNMAFNLREKFEMYCSVEFRVSLNAHLHLGNKVDFEEEYMFYFSNRTPNIYRCKSWEEVIYKYNMLMDE